MLVKAASSPAAKAVVNAVQDCGASMKDIKDLTADEKKLICAKGSAALKQFDLGVQRTKLQELGISSTQRRLNIPHFNSLMKRILFDESFTRERYRELTVIAPDPDKPLKHWEHTRDKCAGSTMLPPVGHSIAMYGIINGQHLASALSPVHQVQCAGSTTTEP